MKFFLDNCVSRKCETILNILSEDQDYQVVHLRSRFPANTPDPVWIKALGDEGDWIIVSGDMKISRSKAEQKAWHESGLTAFFFGQNWANQNIWKQMENLMGWWPMIVREKK